MNDFDKYREWAKQQVCCECGEKATEKACWWVTETQCGKCWERLGPPEKRGLPGAADKFEADGGNIESIR